MTAYILAGLAAGFCIGAVGFADAVFANAIFAFFLGSIGPDTTLSIVSGGTIAYSLNLVAIRKRTELISWSQKKVFFILTAFGLAVAIPATYLLVPLLETHLTAVNASLGLLLFLTCGYNLTGRSISISKSNTKTSLVATVGLISGFLGALAGLSGILTTLWVKTCNSWKQPDARGVYQPFVLIMHFSVLAMMFVACIKPESILNIVAYTFAAVVATILTMVAISTDKLPPHKIERILPCFVNVVGLLAAVYLICRYIV